MAWGSSTGARRFVDKETGVTSDAGSAADRRAATTTRARWAFSSSSCGSTSGSSRSKYEHIWDYEQYCGWPKPAIRGAACAGGVRERREPCVILSHEYMGMPTALAAIAANGAVPHDLLCPRSGHDAADRGGPSRARHDVLQRAQQAMAKGEVTSKTSLAEPDGLLQASAGEGGAVLRQHLRRRRLCGEGTAVPANEDFAHPNIDLAYNGIPASQLTVAEKLRAGKLQQYCVGAVRGLRRRDGDTDDARRAAGLGRLADARQPVPRRARRAARPPRPVDGALRGRLPGALRRARRKRPKRPRADRATWSPTSSST